MSRQRKIALVDVRDPSTLAEQLATALGGRRQALELLERAVGYLRGEQ